MNEFLISLLEDKKGGAVFTCFGIWHFCYILSALALVLILFFALRKKGQEAKERAVSALISSAFGLYMLDFFLMPLAYGAIDIEKLPFHACTATCVLCFVSRHIPRLRRLRVHFALLGFISNFIYLIYPAGVMWHAVHPFCYRVVQTLIFHGVMTAYGLITLLFDEERLSFKNLWKDAIVLASLILWALLGNCVYNGARFYNWFFVVRDPFGLFDAKIAPFVMPFLNFALFFAVEIAICAVFTLGDRLRRKRTAVS